jgi:hypothetical protein
MLLEESMTISIRRAAMFAAVLSLLSLGTVADAADIAGAWSTDASACKSLFVKKGSSVEFAKGAGISGSGFIVAGNTITGQYSSCSIKARKEDGAVLHLAAVCSDDVALSTMQFSVKIVSDNQIVRIFPGMDDLNTAFYRCPM